MKSNRNVIASQIATVAIALASLSACNSSNNSGASQATESTPPQVAQQVAAPPPAPQAPQEFYVGDTVHNSTFEIDLESVKAGTHIESEFATADAAEGGEFVVVIATIKNIGNKPVTVFNMPSLNLYDPNNTKYDKDINSSVAAKSVFGDSSKVLSDLNPGLSTRVVASFEVSKALFNANTWHVSFDDIAFHLTPNPANAQQAAEQAPQQESAPTQQAVQPTTQDPSTEASTTQQADPAADLSTNPNQVYGTSFDCGQSHSQNEYLICHTPALASADVKLANAVAAAKSAIAPSDLDALKDRMRGQWNYREKHCNDVACLNTWYTYQLSTMGLIAQTHDVSARLDTPQS